MDNVNEAVEANNDQKKFSEFSHKEIGRIVEIKLHNPENKKHLQTWVGKLEGWFDDYDASGTPVRSLIISGIKTPLIAITDELITFY